MALLEATTHPVRATDASGQSIYSLQNADGEIVQGIALIASDEAQLAQLEDTAHASGDPGLMLLAVRKDTALGLSSADGNYTPLQVDANGRLRVIPGTPSMTTVAGTKATSGDNELIAAPGASTRIVVSSIVLQNESGTATTMLLKDGSTTKRRYLGQNAGDGLLVQFPTGKEWRLSENSALNLNLSGDLQCGYTIDYWTEST